MDKGLFSAHIVMYVMEEALEIIDALLNEGRRPYGICVTVTLECRNLFEQLGEHRLKRPYRIDTGNVMNVAV